jgi:O-antigen/teichoic acid export membrane protein
MAAGEVKARAATGAVLAMGRGFAFQGLGFLGNLVLARLLVPEEFGLVAIGLAIVNVGQLLAGAGLGSALVAREEPPTRAELAALSGLQLLVTSAIVVLAVAVAAGVGDDALVTAVMVLALPFTAIRTPALLLFQRRLEFVPQVKVEIVEIVVYLAVAITLAALGLGAWSLAIATVVRALIGTLAAVALSPLGFVVPSIRLSRVRSILGFGWRFQAAGISQLTTETALTAGIAALAGLGALGLWSFASRILAIPGLLFGSMWRVGFPAFSRLMQSDDGPEMRHLLERTVGTFAVAASAILCPLVASSPALVPLLFGTDWTDVSLILPGAAIALAIAGPIGMVSSSYFYARGDAGTGLAASIITGAVRLSVTLPLLPALGVVAIGIGWTAGALCAMVFILRRARRASGARLGRRVAGPVASGTLGAAAGWIVADSLGVTVLSAALAVPVAIGLWLLAMLLLARGNLRDGIAMARTVLGSAFGRARSVRRGTPVPVPSSSG